MQRGDVLLYDTMELWRGAARVAPLPAPALASTLARRRRHDQPQRDQPHGGQTRAAARVYRGLCPAVSFAAHALAPQRVMEDYFLVLIRCFVVEHGQVREPTPTPPPSDVAPLL